MDYTVLQGNVAIAEFMEWKCIGKRRYGFAGLFGKRQDSYQKKIGYWHPMVNATYFKYHISWDHLIPVYVKCDTLISDLSKTSVSFAADTNDLHLAMFYALEDDGTEEERMEKLWFAIVDFLIFLKEKNYA